MIQLKGFKEGVLEFEADSTTFKPPLHIIRIFSTLIVSKNIINQVNKHVLQIIQ